jgi:sarcosine oxidase/L-pipecolate oxidase
LIFAAVSDVAFEHIKESLDGEHDKYEELRSANDFHKAYPSGILTGKLEGRRGFWRRNGAGWVAAQQALHAAYTEAVQLRVEFLEGGEKGKVESLLYNDSNTDVIGAVTADGVEHHAGYVILSAGANSDLLLDFKKQLRPTAWTLAYLPLTEDEVRRYRNLPVLYGADRGFFIEPNPHKAEMKICDEHPGYLNFVYDPQRGEKRSIPFARNQIPLEAEQRMRQLLKDTMPQLADRQLSFARICWDADTPDRRFLIDYHPEYPSLLVAAGASGNGFGSMPAVGMVVADAVEGKLEPRLKQLFRWRPETAVDRDWWDTQDRFGVKLEVMDLQKVKEWTDIG